MTVVRLLSSMLVLCSLAAWEAFALPTTAGQLLPGFHCKKIAFYKTHKTGSTTLGGVMFRVAVSSNMSMYTTALSHYVTVGYKEAEQLMGRTDMVLRHIRYSDASNWHVATRNFYARALGTSGYGFVTVLRQPADRYISDFYYYTEPEARRQGRPTTLKAHAAGGGGANRMAGEFAVRNEEEALEFVASEMHSDGLFLPVEYLDYGLALLAGQCGWRLSQVLYLSVNSNNGHTERYGNVTLAARPSVAQLAEESPALLARISRLNALDSILYAAAQGSFLSRLSLTGPGGAAVASVMGGAVRLTATRKRLEAECAAAATTAATAANAAAASEPSASGSGINAYSNSSSSNSSNSSSNSSSSGRLTADGLAGLCAWFSLTDSVYERMPSNVTGRVTYDMTVQGHGATASSTAGTTMPSWRVGAVLKAAEQHLAPYDDPAVPYYHSLLAVRVQPPTAAEVQYLYGGGGVGGAARLTPAEGAAAVASVGEGAGWAGFVATAAMAPDMATVGSEPSTVARQLLRQSLSEPYAGRRRVLEEEDEAEEEGDRNPAGEEEAPDAAAPEADDGAAGDAADEDGGGGGGGMGSAGDGTAAAAGGKAAHGPLAAAVRLWVMHHAAEGLQHLVLCVDGLEEPQRAVVRQAASAALGEGSGGDGNSGSGYTSFELLACDEHIALASHASGRRRLVASAPDAAGAAAEAQAPRTAAQVAASGAEESAALADLLARSRWSARLPSLSHFLHGNRGTVRSVLLSYESQLPYAGAVCAPVVPWQTASPWHLLHGGGGEEAGGAEAGEAEAGDAGDGRQAGSQGAYSEEEDEDRVEEDREAKGSVAQGSGTVTTGGDEGGGEDGDGSSSTGAGAASTAAAAQQGGSGTAESSLTAAIAALGGGGAAARAVVAANVAGGSGRLGGGMMARHGGDAHALGGDTFIGASAGGSAASVRRRRRHWRRGSSSEAGGGGGGGQGGAQGHHFPRLLQHATASAAADSDSGNGGVEVAEDAAASAAVNDTGAAAKPCLRVPCTLASKGMYACALLRSLPLMGHTAVYSSMGEEMPKGRSAYKTTYRTPDHHRVQVVQLLPPSADHLKPGSSAPLRCSRLPRPRLQVPWCE